MLRVVYRHVYSVYDEKLPCPRWFRYQTINRNCRDFINICHNNNNILL